MHTHTHTRHRQQATLNSECNTPPVHVSTTVDAHPWFDCMLESTR
jgi:hypothetical protein